MLHRSTNSRNDHSKFAGKHPFCFFFFCESGRPPLLDMVYFGHEIKKELSAMSIIYALLGISLLVFLHEVGHFVAARLCKLPVLSFGVGFGPALVKFARKGTVYRLNLLPLGGYVTTPAEQTKTSPVPVRLFFYSAGILMNIFTAIVLLTVLFTVTGVPDSQTGAVNAGTTLPFFRGLAYAVTASFHVMGQLFAGFFDLLTGSLSFHELAGPVEMVQLTGHASELGLPFFLYYLSILSLNLAVLNTLPIPSLDGSHLGFALLEVVRRGKRIPLEREAMVHFIGILLMFALMVFVTIKNLPFFS
jgi:membrane-associated protease RseP (regulator of RpoE activity)